MNTQIALSYFFIWLTMFGSSWQDGFNFYKALNRTPMNRVERFYRDGLSSRYKVPLSKRLFYDGFNEQKKYINGEANNNDFLAILFNWGSGVKLDLSNEKKGECAEVQNLIPNVVLV